MAHKHWGRNMIWAIAMNEVKQYFSSPKSLKSIKSVKSLEGHDDFMDFTDLQTGVEWFVKFNKLFLKTNDPQIKIDVFQQKQKILAKVNAAIAKVGYTTKIVDILVK